MSDIALPEDKLFSRRSILVKLILGFFFVSLITVALIITTTAYNTGREFNTYLLDQDISSIVDHFTEYYKAHQSWDGVSETVTDLYTTLNIPEGDPVHPAFTLADSNEVVLISGGYYKSGDFLLQMDQRDSQEITVNGQVVGYLVMRNPFPRPGPEPNNFVQRVNTRLIISGVAAFLFAITLGVIFSRILTRPVRELTAAARAVADGNLDQKVDVHSQDELGELSLVFNEMTTKLSRAMESRRRMTADIAHELRTPISIILGHAEAINDGVLPASEETIQVIRQEAIRLEQLVNDLRVLALSDAGELRLMPIPTQPEHLLKNVFDLFKYQAQSRGIHLTLDCPQNLPEILADQDRLVQVFSNLVDNAMRVTPKQGQIQLSARLVDYQIEFTVSDTGPGIVPEELDKIFDRLYRSDQSRKRDSGGSGLGLAIARTIIEQHGGRIWAENNPDHGACMHILIPTYTR